MNGPLDPVYVYICIVVQVRHSDELLLDDDDSEDLVPKEKLSRLGKDLVVK